MNITTIEWKRICNLFSRNTCIVIFNVPSYKCRWANTVFRRLLRKSLSEITQKLWVDLLPEFSLFEKKIKFLYNRETKKYVQCEVDGTAYTLIKCSQNRLTISFEDKGIYSDYEFLSRISHELRTPLSGIIGVTSLMQETSLTSEQRDYMDTLRESSQSLLCITNDILDVSKLYLHKIQLEKKNFYLRNCIESCFDIIAPEATKKHLDYSFTIAENVPTFIMSDQQRLKQLLINLLSNSTKYTKSGSIRLSISMKEENILFAVKDTGIGISRKDFPRLFKPFTQLDQGITKTNSGTGLGLVISKHLVELFGGKIWFESEPDVGSIFYFTIRAEEGKKEEESINRLENDSSFLLKEKKILIIDDKEENRHYLQTRFFRWHMIPYVFASVDEAINFLRYSSIDIDIACVDVCLPRKSGLDFAKELRENLPTKKFPIIAMSSFGEKIPDEGYFDEQISKPFHEDRLLELLQTMLSDKQHKENINRKRQHNNKRILLVEDTYLNQKTISCMLKHLGFEKIDIANNGVKGLEFVETQPSYDIIITDLKMNIMDGVTMAYKLQKIKKKAKIYALTALTIPQAEKEKYLAEGIFDGYLDKPIDIQTLQAALHCYF